MADLGDMSRDTDNAVRDGGDLGAVRRVIDEGDVVEPTRTGGLDENKVEFDCSREKLEKAAAGDAGQICRRKAALQRGVELNKLPLLLLLCKNVVAFAALPLRLNLNWAVRTRVCGFIKPFWKVRKRKDRSLYIYKRQRRFIFYYIPSVVRSTRVPRGK